MVAGLKNLEGLRLKSKDRFDLPVKLGKLANARKGNVNVNGNEMRVFFWQKPESGGKGQRRVSVGAALFVRTGGLKRGLPHGGKLSTKTFNSPPVNTQKKQRGQEYKSG